MITKPKIDQIKQIPIAEFLEKEGYFPVKKWGANRRFENPIREERTPSFDVNSPKNVWYDHGTGEGGDIIKLVMLYLNCTFREAIAYLDSSFQITNLSHYPVGKKKSPPKIEIKKVRDLQNLVLLDYIKKRCIRRDFALFYLKEVYFVNSNTGKKYFALCWETKSKGYELRNLYFKGCTGKKSYSVITGDDKSEVLLFEGMMDFLSYLTIIGSPTFPGIAIVLNSVNNLSNKLIEKLKDYHVKAFMDNDEAGDYATKKLIDAGVNLTDERHWYKDFSDLNEYLQMRGQGQIQSY